MKRKVASKDFNMSDLPSNRKEVFFDCIKNRFRYLFYSGLLLFVAVIPIIIIYFLKSVNLGALFGELNEGNISSEEYRSISFTYLLIYDGIIVLSSFIASLSICGLTRVVRQIAWEEPLFFIKDFTDGIKMNYKHISIQLFVFSLIYMISDISLFIQMRFAILSYIPFGIFFLVVLPITLYNLSQTNIYIMSNIKMTKNSALFYLKSVPVCVLFSLVILMFSLIDFIPNIAIKLLIFALLIMLFFPLYYLAWFLYSSSIFDKYLNINFYPEIVDKGIVRKEGYKKLEPTINLENKDE